MLKQAFEDLSSSMITYLHQLAMLWVEIRTND